MALRAERRRMNVQTTIAAALLVLLLGSRSSLAAERVAHGGNAAWQVGPEECSGAARSATDMASLLATPVGVGPAPPPSRPLDPATEAAIDTSVHAILACFNAGDFSRAAGLMTDDGVRRLSDQFARDDGNQSAAGGHTSILVGRRWDDAGIALRAVRAASLLADGRVSVIVEIDDPLRPPPGPETWLMVFANQGGRWLLDDLVTASSHDWPTRVHSSLRAMFARRRRAAASTINWTMGASARS